LDKVFAEFLPFSDHSFDHAVCIGALLYFMDPEKALREIHRVTKPGGVVVVRSVNTHNYYTRRTGKPIDPASKNLYELSELIDLIQRSGFTVTQAYQYGFWPPITPNLWWYIFRVWLPIPLQNFLSKVTQPSQRLHNQVVGYR